MGKKWKQTDFLFSGSKITMDGDCSHEIKRCFLLGRHTMTNLDSILKSRDITLLTKVCLVKAIVFPVAMYGFESIVTIVELLSSVRLFCNLMDYSPSGSSSMGFPWEEYWSGLPFPSPEELPDPGIEPVSLALAGGFFATEPWGMPSQSYRFSSSQVWMWELDHKEGWVLKNWCFPTVVLEKTLESSLDCKEIKPVNPKRNQPWIFIGRTDAEAPTLWPLDGKSRLTGKDLMLGKVEGRKWRGWQRMRWLDGITDSMNMGLAKIRRCWRTEKPGVLPSMGLQSDTTERMKNNKWRTTPTFR